MKIQVQNMLKYVYIYINTTIKDVDAFEKSTKTVLKIDHNCFQTNLTKNV